MKLTNCQATEKQNQMLELLKYGTVMAFVDSRHKDVLVPEHLKSDYQLRLNFDYAFEIDDFRVLPDRVEASLSFNRKNSFCVIPFSAVYLLVNNGIQRGSLFVESIPVEMLEVFAASPREEARQNLRAVQAGPIASPAPAPPPAVERAPDPAPLAQATPSSAVAPAPTPRRKGHLRVVK